MSEGNTEHGSWILRCAKPAFVTRVREMAPGRRGVVGSIICLVLLVLVIAIISVRFNGNNDKWDNFYAPGETRTGRVSSVFCKSITLENPSRTSSASVYLLRSEPRLAFRYNFTITGSLVLRSGYYQYWNFYMYPGSNYTFSSCLTSGKVDYYLIQGYTNFQNWYSYLGYSVNHTSYSSVCGFSNTTLSQSFTEEDEYYFVLKNAYRADAKVHVTLTSNRTEYVFQLEDVDSSCIAAPSSKCTLDIPYNSDYPVLIEAGAPGDGDWGTNVKIDAACNPRVWVYVMIILLPTLGIVTLITCIAVVCCYVKRNSRYAPLPRVIPQDGVSMTTIEDSDAANPPPYTPEEVSPPPYKPTPPAYTP